MDVLLEILQELHDDVDYMTREKLVDDKIIDSFDIITMVAEIDDRLGIAIPAQELVPENFNSYSSLVALLTRLEND